MGPSLSGNAQVACKAGKLDDTALNRDRPVTWAGTSKMDRRNYVKFHYHRHNTCSTVVQATQKHRQTSMYTPLEETAPKTLENLYWHYQYGNSCNCLSNFIRDWAARLHNTKIASKSENNKLSPHCTLWSADCERLLFTSFPNKVNCITTGLQWRKAYTDWKCI